MYTETRVRVPPNTLELVSSEDHAIIPPELAEPLSQISIAEAMIEQPVERRNLGNAVLGNTNIMRKKTLSVSERLTSFAVGMQVAKWNIVDSAKRKGGSVATRAALATLALGGGLGYMSFEGVGAAHADADHTTISMDDPTYTVVNADGGFFARNSPHLDDTNRIDGDGIYNGDTFEPICGIIGGDSYDQYNNTSWQFGYNLSRPDLVPMWIPDGDINSREGTNQLAPGESTCSDEGSDPSAITDSAPSASDTSTNELPPATSSGYNGQGAADWALANAKDVQPSAFVSDDDDCTIFVARALIEGGNLPETTEFNLEDWYRHKYVGQHGTPDTWLAPNLIKYILKQYPDSTWTSLDLAQNNQPNVQPGDIIAYSWDDDGQGNPDDINHLTMAVDDAQDNGTGIEYPEIAEWGNLKSGQNAADYQKTGWTWSAYYKDWIQSATNPDGTKAYPSPHAYLLHIVVPSY